MITYWSNDGKAINSNIIKKLDKLINKEKDIKKNIGYNQNTGESFINNSYVYNFVGFLTDNNDDIYAIFPKHYKPDNLNLDCSNVFKCIFKHMQQNPEMYIGPESKKIFSSNFPFAEFFNIYDYYKKYGLYKESREIIKPNIGGRIDWKRTISNSEKVIIRDDVITYPLFYRRKYNIINFISECMIYAINYTVQKFHIFLDNVGYVDYAIPEWDIELQGERISLSLEHIRQNIFNDKDGQLVDSLIRFYRKFNYGGCFYMKHYNFSSIWENMVNVYLQNYFEGVKNETIVFSEFPIKRCNFNKKTFYVNIANKKTFIAPDHYYANEEQQFIFDAKYYNEVNGLSYKEIAYLFMLLDYKKDNTNFKDTYSALILPSENRHTKIHFQIDPIFSEYYQNAKITEEYLDIKQIIKCYIA